MYGLTCRTQRYCYVITLPPQTKKSPKYSIEFNVILTFYIFACSSIRAMIRGSKLIYTDRRDGSGFVWELNAGRRHIIDSRKLVIGCHQMLDNMHHFDP